MSKKKRIKQLETELRILYGEIFVAHNKTGLHAHHNKKLKRYIEVLTELESISLKYKIKRIFKKRGF
jgi:hypothetical protein